MSMYIPMYTFYVIMHTQAHLCLHMCTLLLSCYYSIGNSILY